MIDPSDVEAFRARISAQAGLRFDDDKLPMLADLLRTRVAATHSPSAAGYLERVLPSPDELGEIARRCTVSETYFLRNVEQYRALERAIRSRAERGLRFLRILSAGCSTGEEAYSLAITVRSLLGRADGWTVSVLACDLNPEVLETAATGRYRTWSLRDTPDEVKRTWFREVGPVFVLDESIRSMVRFERRNLARDDPSFWTPERFDVVFCRNVLMYFEPHQMEAAVARITRSLAVGGLLFLGHAENLRGVSQAYHLRNTDGTFYYERRAGDERPTQRIAEPIPAQEPPPPVVLGDTSWFDAITRSSSRIEELSRDRRPAARRPPTAARPLAPAMDLMRRERFEEALAVLAPQDEGPDALLLRASLLVISGDGDRAAEVCARLLAIDELNAGAHYIMALCRDHAGQPKEAIAHDRAAIHLDPGFSMPHLHLGLLSRRAGDLETARRELDVALTLLAREDAARIALFGGGFGRDGLIGVCRGELAACGTAS